MRKVKLKEVTPHPLTELRVISDIEPQSIPVNYEPQNNPISILEHNDYKSKVFCTVGVGDHTYPFEVKSNKWNWIIFPVDEENIYQIPHRFLRGLFILLKNNIRIDGVAIAKPKPREDMLEVIKHEVHHELTIVSRICRVLFFLIAGLRSAIDTINRESQSHVSETFVDIPDPVLLVRIDDKWIEIGRWG